MSALHIFLSLPLTPTIVDLRPIEGEFAVVSGYPRLHVSEGDLRIIRAGVETTHKREWESVLRALDSSDPVERKLATARTCS